MKFLSFTHPKVVPNLYEFLSSSENKEELTKPFPYFFIIWKSIGTIKTLVTNILQHVQQQNEIDTGLEQIWEWAKDDNFHFWVNYPFNIS